METRTRKRRISAAYRYCFARLVLQLWLYCEEVLDGPDPEKISEREMEPGKELTEILGKFLEEKDEEGAFRAFEQLKALRDRIIGRVEILTAFSDCFQIYEYVLNRVERRFVTAKEPESTPKELASALVETLASMEDAAERNGWLRDIVAQLPVRFTRQKFYAMVMERLTSYTGLNRSNVEDYLDMVKSSVMVKLPEGMEQEERLSELLAVLEKADYRAMDKAGFETCAGAVSQGGRLLSAKTDWFVSLQQMINNLYVLFLTEKEKLTDAVEDRNFRRSTGEILEAIKDGDRRILEKNEILTQMEGIQESVTDLVAAGGSGQDEILDKVDRLVSGSYFMPVEERKVLDQEADRQWIDSQAEKFCREMDSLFAGRQKIVVRAVMAKVISSLPMVFRDSLEVEEYIRSSLESCTDAAEREASMELLEQELREYVLV